MKKIISIALALVLILSLSVGVFAAETGSITINNVSKGNTYSIYKLLDLESYNKESGAYSYKVNADWSEFFNQPATAAYITYDAAGYVTWVGGEDDATVAAFAKMALQYAQDNDIDPVDSFTTPEDFTDTSIKFNDLELGWYLVDSTAGALCGLTTTDAHAVINAKNTPPTIDKQVQEDLDGTWGSKNTADIGQIVEFKTIIHVTPGAQNYVLHDKMTEGLTFVHDVAENRGVTKIDVIHNDSTTTTLEEGTDYTVVAAELDDDCTFEVKFTDSFINTLVPNERIIVYYNAMLNRNAVVGGEGNGNGSRLEFGDDHVTEWDETKTYTFSIDIVKTDSSNKLIDGAKFRVYDAATGGNEVAVVPLMENDNVTPKLDENGNPMYRRARADEEGVDIVVKDGKVTVVGFDNGIYYLEETESPVGYNKLTARVPFTISDASLDSVFTDGIYSTGSGVHVVNKTGNMLPETGAMGTTMFIVFGMIVVLGAGVLLVTKKRMGMIQE